jgi:adenylylsulfate kinase-like enzyme
MVVRTDQQTVNECVAQIIDFLKQQYIDEDWVI